MIFIPNDKLQLLSVDGVLSDRSFFLFLVLQNYLLEVYKRTIFRWYTAFTPATGSWVYIMHI